MKSIILGILFSMVGVVAHAAPEPFVVVELFASEGCSSCPPADDLLRELTKRGMKGEKIYTLSFEVDYWNYLGWKDPYSSSEFSQRQYDYTRALNVTTYTPQMIINGHTAFVGSDRVLAEKHIQEALQQPPAQELSLKFKSQNASQVEINYEYPSSNPDLLLQVALVEDGVESKVTTGENRGRTLKHDHIVRAFQSIPLTQNQGQVTIPRPAQAYTGRFSVVAFIQNQYDRKIIAAGALSLIDQ